MSRPPTLELSTSTPVGVGWIAPNSLGMVFVGGVASGVGGAGMMALSQLPWASPGALPLSLALMAPLALALSGLLGLAGSWIAGHRSLFERASKRRAQIAAGALLGLLLLLLSLLGGYLSNILFTDPPLAGYTLHGYALTALVVVAIAAAGWRALWAPELEPWVDATGWRTFVVVGFFLGATSLSLLDVHLYPYAYHRYHLALEAAALAGYIAGLQVATSRQGSRGRRDLALLAVSSLALPLSLALLTVARGIDIEQQCALAVRSTTVHRRSLLLVRALFDSDHDGFSPVLGGGDCDDHDPVAYPLSSVGRDCLGWGQAPPAEPPPLAPAASLSAQAPPVVLLLTIDAFRCGFGQGERAELRDVCPRLAALARAGRSSLSLRVAYPATSPSVKALQRAWTEGPARRGSPLPAMLRRLGYRTSVVATHPYLLNDAEIRAGFDEIDDSLAPLAMAPDGVSSRQTSDHVLRRLDRDHAERIFLWAHFFDPHTPYLREPVERWQPSPLRAYADTIRFTDEQIGRLIDQLDGPLAGRQALILVTSDHGEEFGEHGAFFHGVNLYDTAVRVPFIALRPGGPAPDGPLPASSYDFGRYLLGQLTGSPFRPSSEILLSAYADHDRQIGLVIGRHKLIHHINLGYSELYDLDTDPDERLDLARARPDLLRWMGGSLARHTMP